MKDFYDKLVNILDEAVQKEYDVKLEAPLWELPSKQEFGDLSTMAAMKLASSTKQDPLAIAERLKGILDKELSGIVEKIEILKPAFINIFFSRKIIFDSLSGIHLSNMLKLSQCGALIVPASPGFYTRPTTIEELIDALVARVLDLLQLDHSVSRRWGD
jgi:arginyl-tRNA synthetase